MTLAETKRDSPPPGLGIKHLCSVVPLIEHHETAIRKKLQRRRHPERSIPRSLLATAGKNFAVSVDHHEHI